MGYSAGRDDELLIAKGASNDYTDDYNYDSISQSAFEKGSRPQGRSRDGRKSLSSTMLRMIRSIPAVVLLATWNIMLSVPFGTLFFTDEVPLDSSEKEKLGLRMSLLALGIGQTLMGGGMSSFKEVTFWEIAEVASFYKTFAKLAASNCGDDPSRIYPTTAYLISLSTICTGILYLFCGIFRIGKFMSFFPSYVILGIIAGIGVWATTMSVDVSISSHLLESDDGEQPSFWNLLLTPHYFLSLVLGLAIRPLRILFPPDRFVFLDPIYFLSIPIIFYTVTALVGLQFDDLVEAGYMFKAPDKNLEMSGDEMSPIKEAGKLWTMFDISKVMWGVAFQASPQIVSSAILAFMVSVPFIPPIATLFDIDQFSLDKEFIGHGVSNIISGLIAPGGVPMSACYSSTVLYKNSGGSGRMASCLLASTSFVSFIYGPIWAGYLPRCMASAILIDMGISLFLEGVADPNQKFEPVEYTSIWVILSVMTVFGNTAALISALFMALFTSTISSSGENPVRRVCDAVTFPSSRHRRDTEMVILDDPKTGRSKIFIFQLQGSLFFGNLSKVQDQLFRFLAKREMPNSIVIFDCTLVSSLDSSACIFFDKIQSTLKSAHGVATIVFVASPSKLQLKKAPNGYTPLPLSQSSRSGAIRRRRSSIVSDLDNVDPANAFSSCNGENQPSNQRRRSCLTIRGAFANDPSNPATTICGSRFDKLDEALASCEDELLSLANHPSVPITINEGSEDLSDRYMDKDPDRFTAIEMLKIYCQLDDFKTFEVVIDHMTRELLPKGTVLWSFGDEGDCAKLFLSGSIFAYGPVVDEDDDDKRFRSSVTPGSFLGLRSLVLDEYHVTTARCDEDCLVYSLEKDSYELLVNQSPEVARLLELSLARYLSHRLRHVSNHIYQARSLPV